MKGANSIIKYNKPREDDRIMDDTKKLKENEIEQISGGSSGEQHLDEGHVINPNGTDLYDPADRQKVIKHLAYNTHVYFTARHYKTPYVHTQTDSGEVGYVLFEDLSRDS